MQREDRNTAVDRLKSQASELGTDAIVLMRFDSGTIQSDLQSVIAYGTAVKFI